MITEIKGIILRSWQNHFLTNFATTIVLAMSFSLILGTILVSFNLERLLTVWGNEVQITIYIKDHILPEDKTALEKSLHDHPGVESVQFISKEVAGLAFEKSLSHYGPNFIESIKTDGENPFPASYLIRLQRDEKTPEKIELMATHFSSLTGVEDVSYGQEWVKNYALLLKASRAIALIFALIIISGCLFAVSNSIRASLFSRREEIEILELVGATARAIRKPFLIEGAFQGAIATVISVLCLALVYRVVYQSLEHTLGSSSITSTMSFFPFHTLLICLGAGIAIGALGSYLCVARLNTGWAASAEA